MSKPFRCYYVMLTSFLSSSLGHCMQLFRQQGRLIEPKVSVLENGLFFCFVWLSPLSAFPIFQVWFDSPAVWVLYHWIHRVRKQLGCVIHFHPENHSFTPPILFSLAPSLLTDTQQDLTGQRDRERCLFHPQLCSVQSVMLGICVAEIKYVCTKAVISQCYQYIRKKGLFISNKAPSNEESCVFVVADC